MSAAKDKGTRAETAAVIFLDSLGFYARRLPPSGARDVGDIEITGYPIAFEVKASVATPYGVWLGEVERERINAGKEIGVVIHKPKGTAIPERFRVIMTLADFAKLLKEYALMDKDSRITHCDECGRRTDDLVQCGVEGLVIDGVPFICDSWLCVDCR